MSVLKKILKIVSLIASIGLFVISILLLFTGLGGIFAVMTVILGFFYLSIYLLVFTLNKYKKDNNLIYSLLMVLFLIPIIWLLIDIESLINFLMQGVHLDMK